MASEEAVSSLLGVVMNGEQAVAVSGEQVLVAAVSDEQVVVAGAIGELGGGEW